MGACIYYRSLRTVSAAQRSVIETAAKAAEEGRTWLSCEPVHFGLSEGGSLRGGSKPNFSPDAEEVAAAGKAGLPDGSVLDLLDVLSNLSREYGIDWEVTFEEGPPVGYIRNGHCDPEILVGAEQLVQVGKMLAEMSL